MLNGKCNVVCPCLLIMFYLMSPADWRLPESYGAFHWKVTPVRRSHCKIRRSPEEHGTASTERQREYSGEVMSHHEVTQKVAKQRDISRLSLYGKKPLDPLTLIGLRCCTAELSPARLISGI